MSFECVGGHKSPSGEVGLDKREDHSQQTAAPCVQPQPVGKRAIDYEWLRKTVGLSVKVTERKLRFRFLVVEDLFSIFVVKIKLKALCIPSRHATAELHPKPF